MTFSFNHLGNLGHLGNQMFQYAALLGFSKKHNTEFCIPHEGTFGKHYYTKLRSSIYDAFDINPKKGISTFPTVNEAHFHFDEELFNNPPHKNINLYGFFQTEKYFENVKEEVRNTFQFKEEYFGIAKEMRSQLSGEIISLHVRRTDYVNNPGHDVCELEYYERALKEVPDDCKVIIFTDDPEWVKVQEIFPDNRFFVSETDCPYTDMCLMTLCDYHILCNSSFSWWGAWLSKSKKVIAPKVWFGPALNHNIKDLYCDGWVVI